MENTLEITRVFNAPIELLWKTWINPEYITQWWGPKGFTTKVNVLDFRIGGKWEYIMVEDATGKEYPAVGIFQEIVEFKKISSTDDFGADMKANAEFDLPKILLFTGLFEDLGDKSKLTLIYQYASPADKEKHLKMGVKGGWNSSLDKLEELFERGV